MSRSRSTFSDSRHHLADQRVGGFATVPRLVASMGADPGAVLAEAGLDASALDDPGHRIPYVALGRVLKVAAQHTRCPYFGLVCGQQWQFRDLGLIGEIALNCATVGEALRTFTVYQRLNSGGGIAYLIDHHVAADFGYAIYLPGVEGSEQIYGAALASGCNYLRELCGGASPVDTILLPHARPARADEYRRILRRMPRFDADRAVLRFRSEWLAHRISGADGARRAALEDQALALGPGDFLDRVVRSLRTLLIMGRHSGDDVARLLALHRRTLNRRLKALGTSFQAVLDGVRFEMAQQFLSDGEIPMEEIALVLGYSGLSAFQRTFRRWSGQTPGKWRRDSLHGARATHVHAQSAPLEPRT